MILITDIKIMEVDSDWHEIHTLENSSTFEEFKHKQTVHREIVVGERFVNSRGEEVLLGLCKESQDLIGLPMKVFKTMREEAQTNRETINQLRSRSAMYQERLERIDTMNFWGRIKFIFKIK